MPDGGDSVSSPVSRKRLDHTPLQKGVPPSAGDQWPVRVLTEPQQA